jgi:hypothetical protein
MARTLIHGLLTLRVIAVETHLFQLVGRGFGLRRAAGKPVAVWPDLFREWARVNGLW